MITIFMGPQVTKMMKEEQAACESGRNFEGDKAHSEYEDEGLIISPDAVFEDDDDHSQAFLGLVRRLVLTSTKKSEDNQRHNIFQTRCKINQDVFNVIIDGGSSENIISRDIVTRLKLRPTKHPKPYKIGWIKAVER
nr:hypothetical protein [Tanacetum cinerariifolium]